VKIVSRPSVEIAKAVYKTA